LLTGYSAGTSVMSPQPYALALPRPAERFVPLAEDEVAAAVDDHFVPGAVDGDL